MATSFEWKQIEGDDDDDTTTDRMSPQDGALPHSVSNNDHLQVSTPTNMIARIKRSAGSHLSHVYISDDEGAGDGDVEEFGTDSFRKRLKPLIGE